MTHWGWRPLLLWIFISVLVTGCTDTQLPTPSVTPTTLPPITLTVQILPPSMPEVTPTHPGLPIVTTLRPASPTPAPSTEEENDRPTSTALPTTLPPTKWDSHFNTPAPHNNRDTPVPQTPTPLPLALGDPICYETYSEGILCLGHIDNDWSGPVERVVILVEIFQMDGTLLRTQETAVEQRYIPTGAAAPYRALFTVDEDAEELQSLTERFGAVIATLLRAERGLDIDEYLTTLQVEEEHGEQINGRYTLTARLHNASTMNIQTARLVVTLFDEVGRVAGYRIVELEELKAGGTVSVQVEVMSQIIGVPLRHTLHIEAQR